MALYLSAELTKTHSFDCFLAILPTELLGITSASLLDVCRLFRIHVHPNDMLNYASIVVTRDNVHVFFYEEHLYKELKAEKR